MARRSKGLRSKSRQILRRTPRERGEPPVTHALRELAEGAKVAIKINSSVHAGMPHIRFQGHTGTIQGKQGRSYKVQVVVGDKPKNLVIRPEHLKPLA